MSFFRKFFKLGFYICDRILPAYNYCRWGNKLKNAFAKRAFVSVGKNVNWGKSLTIASNFKIGNYSGVGDNAIIHSGVTIGNDVMIGKNLKIFKFNQSPI